MRTNIIEESTSCDLKVNFTVKNEDKQIDLSTIPEFQINKISDYKFEGIKRMKASSYEYGEDASFLNDLNVIPVLIQCTVNIYKQYKIIPEINTVLENTKT